MPFYQSTQQYLDVILFLEELLHHYSSHNVHPKFLVQDLLTGQCLTDLEQQSWIDHLHDLKEVPANSGDFRRHLRSHRLQRIESCSSTSYFTMSDKELQHSIKTIQQLLVEYGVLFSGGGMTSDDEELAYTQVGYESLLENHLNIGGFAGFNLGTFHKHLLKFWYHQNDGLFVGEQSLFYIADFERKLTDSVQQDSSPNRQMNQWMQWSMSVLSAVILILRQYFYMTISSYNEEDQNRVTLLVWEVVLSRFDAIDGPIDVTWTAKLRQDIRIAYIQYHSNINYVVDIKVAALHITDATMLRITGSFDDPPDSSQIRSRFAPSPSIHQSASSNITLSQQRHSTSTISSTVPTNAAAVPFQQNSLPLNPRARNSLSSNVFGLGSPISNSIRPETINVHSSQLESDTDEDDIPSRNEPLSNIPLSYGVIQDADPIPMSVSIPSSIPISSIPISVAYPADHKLMQWSSNMKQDSQIQSLVSSHGSLSMYPVSVQADPPVPIAPVALQAPSNSRRVAPVLVNTANKRLHFPTKLHAYFINDDYPPEIRHYEREFLDNCIIQHCCVNDKMIRLPCINDDTYINELKLFQTNNLIQQKRDFIAPSLWLEVMYNYMENMFVIQKSTIPDSGDGLFLLAGKSLPRNLLLPYPGVILPSTDLLPNQLRDNDKFVCLRKNIYLNGSEESMFPITCNRYLNYLAKANEMVCKNMSDKNHGQIVTCGLVLFEEALRADELTEIFVLYSPLNNSISALLEEPIHRTVIKRMVLSRLFEHLDDCFINIKCYMELRPQLRIAFNQLRDKITDLNLYRSQGSRGKIDHIVRFVKACVSVVDGRFIDYLQYTHQSLAVAMKSKKQMSVKFNKHGHFFLPEALLIHIYSWFYYGNYVDPTCNTIILQQGYQHHRQLILYMVNTCCIPTTNKINKLKGFNHFVNPSFPIESHTTNIDSMPDDTSSNNDDDNDDDNNNAHSDDDIGNNDDMENDDTEVQSQVDSIKSLSIPASTSRPLPVPGSVLQSIPVPSVVHPLMSTPVISNIVPPLTVNSVQRSILTINQHEKSEEPEANITTPLTHATQREHQRQELKSLLYEEGILDIALRHRGSRDRHDRRESHHTDRPTDQYSHSTSSTQSIEPDLHLYDPKTLPNTIQQSIRWTGTNNKSYDYYMTTRYGRLSDHHLVKNSLDIHSQSILYSDIMILTTILLSFWSVEIATYHRVDRSKNDFSINDRAKIPLYDATYDGTTCLYSYTGALLQFFAQRRLPYVFVYNILSQGTDLKGRALNEWKAQVESANSSLVQDDITNSILRAPSLHCYQMRDIVEMIVDLIVFRVLIFDQLKNKALIKQDLYKLKLESNLTSVTYDGILKLSQTLIRTFRLFIKDDGAVQDLVKTLSGCIRNTGNDYTQKSADFNTALSTRIQQFIQSQDSTFQSLDRQDQNLKIYAVIEKYCRELQDSLRQTFNINGQSLAMTSVVPPYASASATRYHQSSSGSHSSYRSRDSPTFKRVNVHSALGHISERVDARINKIHEVVQAKLYTFVLDDYDTCDMPDGAILTVAEGATEPTIHIQVAPIHDLDAKIDPTTITTVDTKFTVDKIPYTGNCSLCGERRHDDKHCRMKSYEDETKINLANYSYFTDNVLNDKIRMACEYGFLRGATSDEMKWVLDKIRELRNTRLMLYATMPQQPQGTAYPQRSSTPPRSYGYNRPSSPSPYERQYHQPSNTNQSL